MNQCLYWFRAQPTMEETGLWVLHPSAFMTIRYRFALKSKKAACVMNSNLNTQIKARFRRCHYGHQAKTRIHVPKQHFAGNQ